MKKYLLSDKICVVCNGTGVMRESSNSFRIRVSFTPDDWHILDDLYESKDEAVWAAIEMKHGDQVIKFEIVSPGGEIIAVE